MLISKQTLALLLFLLHRRLANLSVFNFEGEARAEKKTQFLVEFFCARGKVLKKKQDKKGVFSFFLEIFEQKSCVISTRASPSKLVNSGSKNFRVRQPKWISQNSTK